MTHRDPGGRDGRIMQDVMVVTDGIDVIVVVTDVMVCDGA